LQPVAAAALRKHGARAHPQFFELIEGHHAFTPHKLLNQRFCFPKRSLWELLHQDRDFSTINAIKR
jgi:hypothetical protein